LAAMPDVKLPRGNDTTTVDSRWAALLKAAQLARHAARVKFEGNLDVVDPFRQNDQVYDRMVEELLPALKTIVEFELIHATEQQSIDSRLEL
jgi:protein-tyrosine phosphatase